MSRVCLRLMVGLSLVAYSFANTHLGLALAAIAVSGKATVAAEGNAPTKCRHCVRHATPKKDQSPSHQTPRHGEPHPFGDDDPCPVPGGCTICSAAKSQCVPAVVTPCPASGPVEFVSPSDDSISIRPVLDDQIRPPRV